MASSTSHSDTDPDGAADFYFEDGRGKPMAKSTVEATSMLSEQKTCDGKSGKPPISAEVCRACPSRPTHAIVEAKRVAAGSALLLAAWTAPSHGQMVEGARHARCSLPTQRSPPCAHGV